MMQKYSKIINNLRHKNSVKETLMIRHGVWSILIIIIHTFVIKYTIAWKVYN